MLSKVKIFFFLVKLYRLNTAEEKKISETEVRLIY